MVGMESLGSLFWTESDPFVLKSMLNTIATSMLGLIGLMYWCRKKCNFMKTMETSGSNNNGSDMNMKMNSIDTSILPCIRQRRSIFPSEYDKSRRDVDPTIIQSLLDAALWSPWHGRCYGSPHPAKFVVLGQKGMVDMQELTLQYYDRNWRNVGWGSGKHGSDEEYKAWRKMTHEEITGRWGSVSYMIAIIMQRQSGTKRLPEWEEAASTATAVHNMHLQATKYKDLACYWSSWHDAARDCHEMKEFLKMDEEDKCLGFFIVAQVKLGQKDRRMRDTSMLTVEWRD